MKQIGLFMVSCWVVGLIACNPGKKAEQAQTEAVAPARKCFQYIAENDTVSISFDVDGSKVTGSLFYNLYEKDKSHGTLVGEMNGDTLLADYTFFAEGTTSVSEVVFLRRNNQLIQGFGETTTSAGKQIFKNRNTLDFSDSLVLTETECEKK